MVSLNLKFKTKTMTQFIKVLLLAKAMIVCAIILDKAIKQS